MPLSNGPTLVPYGEQTVPLSTSSLEPDQITTCHFCGYELEWEWETDDFGHSYMRFARNMGYVEWSDRRWCSDRCCTLSKLDQRPFYLQRVKDAITFELPEVAAMYAKQLISFSLAFEQAIEGVI